MILKHNFVESIVIVECGENKDKFLQKVREVAEETKKKVEQRVSFEDNIMKIYETQGSTEDEKATWMKYIGFEKEQNEVKRVKLLFERGKIVCNWEALISLDHDLSFFFQYLSFIENQMKDPTLVRAKFETRLKISQAR